MPLVTRALVGMNFAVFLAMVLTGVSPVNPNIPQLLKWGANWGPLSLHGQPWRILTSNYVHIGILHIALNMWCLWNLGGLAELIFGGWTLLLTYTLSGLAGSIASLWWHPMVVGAGASGAIFGLAGALIAALYLGKLGVSAAGFSTHPEELAYFCGLQPSVWSLRADR
jgi:membrane associated rhomboid family serine protease